MLLKSLGAVGTKLAKSELWCYFFLFGAEAPSGPGPPHLRGS